MQIDQATIAQTLQLGSQYAIPAAATLRALYSGYKGNVPEGIGQIFLASLLAGVTAIADNKSPDVQSMIKEVAGNTVFLTGLLSFVVIYLLGTRFRVWLDAVVGAVLGFVGSWIWFIYLGHADPFTGSTLFPAAVTKLGIGAMPLTVSISIALAAVAGAAILIVLHNALRHIMHIVRLATGFLVIGIVLMVAAGGLYVLQQQHIVNLPIPGLK